MIKQASAIIVSHNSEQVLPLCLARLAQQSLALTPPMVVDSGSRPSDYLDALQREFSFRLLKTDNIGFSRANNLGFTALVEADDNSEMIVFLNPDTLLPPGYLAQAAACLDANPQAAIVAGRLLGYDAKSGQATGKIDSTGVFRSWYGRWYDRDQGKETNTIQRQRRYLPAACGALLCCRRTALEALTDHIFDPDFFLYKEDIELCLRLRKKGWQILYQPDLTAYHCRGWDNRRGAVPYRLRKIAAASELVLYRKHPSIYIIWALLKYIMVHWGRL